MNEPWVPLEPELATYEVELEVLASADEFPEVPRVADEVVVLPWGAPGVLSPLAENSSAATQSARRYVPALRLIK